MIEIRMFGRFTVRDGDDSLGPKDFGGVKPKQVLQVLLLGRGQPVSKDRIADLLWGDDLPRNISATLETYISVLRRSLRRLGPQAASLIATEAGGYRINQSPYTLDLDRFDDLMTRARAAEPDDASRLTDAALALVVGDVLADEPYASFAQEWREQYTERHVASLLYGARLANARGDFGHAVALAKHATEVAPLSETGWRKLMLAQYALGHRASALRSYARCKQMLFDELGVEPAQETRRLHAAILREDSATDLIPAMPPVWAAVAAAGSTAQTNGATVATGSPLFGRSAELARAVGLVQEALDGRFTVLLLDGTAGMGKTSFLDAVVSRVRSLRSDTRVSATGGHQLKRSLAGVMAGDALQVALAGVAGVAEVLDAAVSRNGGIGWLALDRLAELLAGAGPVLLVFDDLHEADTVSLSVLTYLRQRIPEAPVAVLAAAPFRQLAGDHPLRTLPIDARLQLDVLRPEDVRDVSPALWARTGGHPQLLAACLKAAVPESELPTALQDLVLTRVREAGPLAHTVLLTATLFDRPFSAEELAVTETLQPLEVIDELERAVERGILTMTGTRFSFRYPAVRDILLQSMSKARRNLLSRRLETPAPWAGATMRRSDPDPVPVPLGVS